MTAQAESIRRNDSLGPAFLRSLLLHGAVAAVTLGFGMWNLRHRDVWGDPNANPGAGFSITPVDRIPLPVRQSRPNVKAEDVESQVERVEKKDLDRDRQKQEEKDAVELSTKERVKPPSEASSRYKYRSSDELRKNALKTSIGQAVSTPMYGAVGAGGVGVGSGTPFGNRFGAYAELLRRRISEKWKTTDVDAVARNARPATVSFDILRDGTVKNVQIVQSSGVPTLDYSAKRAVLEAAPLPELPREFDRNSANVEFTFQLQR